jgi:hypothetical protein
MHKKTFFILSLGLFLFTCSRNNKTQLAPEYLFDQSDEHVICSLINNKQGTISLIYGNDLAIKYAQDTLSTHVKGEKFVMVTWMQKPMPHWYGTNMNGNILSVETVNVSQTPNGNVMYDYQLKQTDGRHLVKRDSINDKRIKLITSQMAAVFP